jgi:hypothetical protein
MEEDPVDNQVEEGSEEDRSHSTTPTKNRRIGIIDSAKHSIGSARSKRRNCEEHN